MTIRQLVKASLGVRKCVAESVSILPQVTVTKSLVRKMDGEIEETFPLVSGVPTCLLKCGGRTKFTDVLVFIIPGNPGVPDYYREYMATLHKATGVRVWCIEHAGHSKLPPNIQAAGFSEKFCSLPGQIEHKLSFIKDNVSSNTKLILVGHSIGAYMVLHLLDKLEETYNVTLSCLLFPTIERMALSPQGKWSTPSLKYFRWLAPILLYVPCAMLPSSTVRNLLGWYFKDSTIEQSTVPATQKLADPWCVKRILAMANEEMQKVVDPDHDIIHKHKNKLLFYYGASDHWCPVDYYRDMIAKHDGLDARLCTNGYKHAFVLGDSVGVANLTSLWIKEKVDLS